MLGRLSPSEDALLKDFVARLLAAAPEGSVRAVRVFGSRARGGSNERSDLDVAVELALGVEQRALHYLVADAAADAMEAMDAYDLGLAPVALPPGPAVGLRAAIERDGLDVWRAPAW